MSEASVGTMVGKLDCSDRDSSNKLVDSSSNRTPPPVTSAGTGATNTAPTQVQSPHRSGQAPWDGVPVTHSIQGPQRQALPWETVSVTQSVIPYSQSGWTSVPNSPSLKRSSYSSKRDSSSVFESESDSELSSMEGPSSYFSFGKNLQRSQSNISERSYSYLQDKSVSKPMSMYGSMEQLYSGGYPCYTNLGSPSLCNTGSTNSIPASVGSMDIYYPSYSVSTGYPVSSAGYSPMCQNMYHPYWMCYSCRKPKM